MKFRLSMLVFLSIGVPHIVAVAAEDDAVIDVTIAPPLTAPVPDAGNIVHTMRDGKPIILYFPRDRSAEEPALLRQLDVFLKKVDAECALNDDQMLKIELAGRREISQITQPQEPIELIEDVLNGKTIYRVADTNVRRVRTSTGADFLTTDSLVYKIVQTQLTPEQKQKFQALRDRERNAIAASRGNLAVQPLKPRQPVKPPQPLAR